MNDEELTDNNVEFLEHVAMLNDIATTAVARLKKSMNKPENAAKRDTYEMIIEVIETQNLAIVQLSEDRLRIFDEMQSIQQLVEKFNRE